MNGDEYSGRQGFRLVPILIGLVLIGVTALRGCQEGPFGRHQVVELNPQQEAALGAEAYGQVLAQSQLVEGGRIVDVVRRLAKELVEAAERADVVDYTHLQAPDFRWECNVVRSKQVNAFCLPGGKIVVYTGILPVAQDEAGLATVLGHEVSHAIARHGAQRVFQNSIMQTAMVGAAYSLSDMDPQKRQTVMGLLGAG